MHKHKAANRHVTSLLFLNQYYDVRGKGWVFARTSCRTRATETIRHINNVLTTTITTEAAALALSAVVRDVVTSAI
jgi:hypothetical protein